ncbi:MAG: hypothetical protein Q4F74_04200 [Synergistaceae bacterium]|nr:hypothetical protein [Synergistaceae bacterium]
MAATPRNRLDKIAANLKTALARCWDRQTRDFLLCLLDASSVNNERITEEYVSNIESLAGDFLGKGLESAARRPIIEMSSRSYLNGKQTVSADFALTVADQKAIEMMQKYSFHWVGRTYDRFVSDEINQAVGEYFKRGLTRAQLAEGLEIIFKDHETPKVEGYFSLLADHLTMKISEMGHVASYEEAGIEYIEIVARLDERTTAICRALHGRVIPLSVMSGQRDRMLSAAESGDMEAVKRAQPMISGKLEKRLSFIGRTSDLIKEGIGMPPYHFRCRTTTAAHFEPATYHEKVAQWAIDGEAPHKEVSKLLAYAKNAHWGTHKLEYQGIWREAARHHYIKHANDVGVSSMAEYNTKLMELVRGGKRDVFVAIKEKEHPHPVLMMRDNKTQEYVVININGQQIASYYRLNDKKWEKLLQKQDVLLRLPREVSKWIGFMNFSKAR